MRIGVIGSGQVGQALAKGLKKHGYETRIGSRTAAKLGDFSKSSGIQAGTFAEVAAWAEGVVLAVKGDAAEAAVRDAGPANLSGKLAIDTTNPIAPGPPEDGVVRFFTSPNDSLMERLQTAFPDVKFVKAFNSVGCALMVNPSFPSGRPTMFYCGNDAARRPSSRKSSISSAGKAPKWERRKRPERSSRFANSGASPAFARTAGRTTHSLY